MDAKTYLDFDLLFEPGDAGYCARVLDSPTGQANHAFHLPFADLEVENYILRMGQARRDVRRLEDASIEAAKVFGGRLYESIFAGELGECLHSSLAEATRQDAGLRLRLRFSDTPELLDLPWEFLYEARRNRFLALSVGTSLVRYLDLPGRITPLAVTPPLQILVMIASPSDYPPLDAESEWRSLKAAMSDLEQRGLVVMERLSKATLAALQPQLRRKAYHIFHYIGHGGFDSQTQDGLLVLEDEQGKSRPVSGQYLGMLLHDETSLRLALLNACEGGRTSRSDPFAGVCQSLLQQGVPAVIAMQFAITNDAAVTLATEFYAALTEGYPVDTALTEARKAIFAHHNGVEWGTPVLYLRAPDGQIFEVAADKPAVASETQPAQRLQNRTTDARGFSQYYTRRTLLWGIAVVFVTAILAGLIWRWQWLRPPALDTGATAATAAVMTTPLATVVPDPTTTSVATPPASMPARAVTAENIPSPSSLTAMTADTFNNGELHGWEDALGLLRVVQDEQNQYVLQMEAPAGSFNAASPLDGEARIAWRDYVVEFRLRISQPGVPDDDFSDVWLAVRHDPNAAECQGYDVSISATGRQALITSIPGNNCPWRVIASRSYPFEPDVWYNVRVEVENSQLRLSVDDVPVLAAQDEHNQHGFFYVSLGPGTVAQFDDVRYWQLP